MTFIERHISIVAFAILGMIAVRVFMISDANALKVDGFENGFMQYKTWLLPPSVQQTDLGQMISMTLHRKRNIGVSPDQDLITGSTNTAGEKKPGSEPAAAPPSEAKTQATQTPDAPKTKAEEASSKPGSAEAAAMPSAPAQAGAEIGAEKSLLERLGLRRSELDKREEELANREALLQAAEKRLAERSDELKKLEADLKARTDQRNAELTSLKPIVTIYETMKPKDAARVFEKLELANLLLVAGVMNPRKLADVLAQMDPVLAGKVTKNMSASGRAAVLPQPVAKAEGSSELPDLSPQGTP